MATAVVGGEMKESSEGAAAVEVTEVQAEEG